MSNTDALTPEEIERDRFIAWAKVKWPGEWFGYSETLNKNTFGFYSAVIDSAWVVWLAAKADSPTVAPADEREAFEKWARGKDLDRATEAVAWSAWKEATRGIDGLRADAEAWRFSVAQARAMALPGETP